MPPAEDVVDADEAPRKRRRGPYACSLCRQRKVRCDGKQPCANCAAGESDCTYGSEPVTKGKSDAILETVLRLEDRLSHLTGLLVSQHDRPTVDHAVQSVQSPQTASTTEPSIATNTRHLVRDHRTDERRLDNAAISARHVSTTESVLSWPFFDAFPGLRSDYQSIFSLEQHRSHPVRPSLDELPMLHADEARAIIDAFQNVVNFSYPAVSVVQLADVESRILHGSLDDTIECCHALLVMALGCASQAVGGIAMQDQRARHNEDHSRRRSRDLALLHFGLVLKRVPVMHIEISTTATLCLFFMGLFFAYLQMPLQAWSYISTAAGKCRLLLSYTSADAGADTECLRRVFWSCYILESDYVAELAALPQSGISEMESSVPFAGYFPGSEHDVERQQSSLYFLACVSMRRLLNRVHDLLYAPGTGVGFDDARFPHIVSELDHQLEEWRECLPPSFRFSIDTGELKSSAAGFLRQRYLTCRAVIYRPYLNQALSRHTSGDEIPAPVLDRSAVCLNMCLLHILNLRAFAQTVLVDTWTCSLSMASTMLLLLAASQVPELKERMGTRVLQAGGHLVQLIHPWLHIHGEQVSPSVQQSLNMIASLDELLEQEYDQA